LDYAISNDFIRHLGLKTHLLAKLLDPVTAFGGGGLLVSFVTSLLLRNFLLIIFGNFWKQYFRQFSGGNYPIHDLNDDDADDDDDLCALA